MVSKSTCQNIQKYWSNFLYEPFRRLRILKLQKIFHMLIMVIVNGIVQNSALKTPHRCASDHFPKTQKKCTPDRDLAVIPLSRNSEAFLVRVFERFHQP